jgi:hypothetical protein
MITLPSDDHRSNPPKFGMEFFNAAELRHLWCFDIGLLNHRCIICIVSLFPKSYNEMNLYLKLYEVIIKSNSLVL